MKKRIQWSVLLMVSVYCLLSFPLRSSAMPDEATQVRISQTYGQLPLYFEANQGQTDSQVIFMAGGRGNTLFLTATEAVLALRQPHAAQTLPRTGRLARATDPEDRQIMGQTVVLRLRLLGANPQPQVTGLDELPGKVHYVKGNDPAQWRTHIPTYAKVKYEAVYPGVDLIYYGNQRQLEYDFVLAPGADPQVLTLSFQGADHLEVNGQGDLLLQTAAGTIRLQKPVIYQEVDGVRRDIAGGYVSKAEDQVGFQVAAYDASRPLVIDPVLFYSTYLGGNDFDWGVAIAVDAVGNAYVTGRRPVERLSDDPRGLPDRTSVSARRLRDEAEFHRQRAGLLHLPRQQWR